MPWKAAGGNGTLMGKGAVVKNTERVKLRAQFLRKAVQHTYLAAGTDLWRIGIFNLWDVLNAKRSHAAPTNTERSSHFSVAGDDTVVQWEAPVGIDFLDDAYTSFFVDSVRLQVRFECANTSIHGIHLFWKVLWPHHGDDYNDALLDLAIPGSIAATDNALGDQAFRTLVHTPGVRYAEIGPNNANGLSNSFTVDVWVRLDKIRNIRTLELDDDNAAWKEPLDFNSTTSIPNNLYPRSPYVCFWAFDGELSALENNDLYAWGVADYNVRIFSEASPGGAPDGIVDDYDPNS